MGFLKRVLILLLAPAVLLALLYGWVALRTAKPNSSWLVRTADRKVVWVGRSVEVTLHLNADKEVPLRPPDAPRNPNVIALVLDHSGSMGEGPGSPLEAVKGAAAMFAQTTASPEQPVGIITFDSSPSVVKALNSDGAEGARAIRDIPSGGGTDIGSAVNAGRDMVLNGMRSGQYPRATGLIILMSDGNSSKPEALQAAQQAKNDGIRIITIGLGSQVDEELLRQMATTEADFHFTLDPAALGDIYSGIAADFGTAVGYNGHLVEQYHYGGFTLEHAPAGFRVQIDEAHGRLECQLPIVFQQHLAIPYRLKAQKVGLYGLALRQAEFLYVPDNNHPEQTRKILSSLAPPLLVISPLLLFLLWLPLLAYLLWRLWRLLIRRPAEIPQETAIQLPRHIAPPPPLPLREPRPIRPREPQPTLFLGIGEAGSVVLTRVAGLLSADHYLAKEQAPPFHLLWADTRIQHPHQTDVRFPIHKAQLPSSLGAAVRDLQRGASTPPHLGWLPKREVAEISGAQLDLSGGSHGRRWLSRLALFEAARTADAAFFQPWQEALDWLRNHRGARVVIVGSIEGGTASGLLSDLAYLIRHALPGDHRPEHPIYAVALADIPSVHAYTAANQQAFLGELDRFRMSAHIPQPMVYRPNVLPQELAYLNGRTEEAIYDYVFLLQCSLSNPDLLEQNFLAQVGAFCHTLTEHSLVDSVEAQLGASRSREQIYQNQKLEGTVHTAWEYVLRFPAPEIDRRLACRFVLDVLGTNRLVGVDLSPDGRTLLRPQPPENALEDAVALWTRMEKSERDAGTLYQAWCQAAVTRDPRTAVPAMQRACGDAAPPSAEVFRDELRQFAGRWFYLLLNGFPQDTDDVRADWRRHRITTFRAVLERLVEFSQGAVALEKQRTAASPVASTATFLGDLDRFHSSWLADVDQWLGTLVDTEFISTTPGSNLPGVYRAAADQYEQIADDLAEENRASWRVVLTSEETRNSKLREDAFYAQYFGEFLKRERGFLPRWLWEFTSESGEDVPKLRLRLITDVDRQYSSGGDTVHKLLDDLCRIAGNQTGDLWQQSILDALRSDSGDLRLESLSRGFAERIKGDLGLRINRQFSGGDQIQRQVFAMVPDLRDEELTSFEGELRHYLPCPLMLVRHGDPHTIRLLVLDLVIPIRAALVGRNTQVDLPFIFPPEQEGERSRRDMGQELGIAPIPQLHPLTRLLAAAPRPRAEWCGVLAENALVSSMGGGVHRTIMIQDGTKSEALVDVDQGDSWVWAIINMAYRTRGAALADVIAARWRSRDDVYRIERLAQCIETWNSRLVQMSDHQIERLILGQIVLLLQLEQALEQRRQREAAT